MLSDLECVNALEKHTAHNGCGLWFLLACTLFSKCFWEPSMCCVRCCRKGSGNAESLTAKVSCMDWGWWWQGVEGGEFGGSEWEINIHTLGIKYTSGFNNAMKKNRVETVNSNWTEKAEEPLAVFKKEVKQMFSMAVMFWPNLKDVKGGHWKCPGEEGFRQR